MLTVRSRRRANRGVALVEFQIVALLALFPLLLGMLQLMLLLMASHVLQYATFQAARAGAVSGADPQVMRRALSVGLLPLHAVTAVEITPANAAAVALAAYGRSLAATAAFAEMRILGPSAAAFEDFATADAEGAAIRNDALEHRPLTPGSRSGLSLQQANLLTLQVRYCQPLIVPLVDRLLLSLLRVFTTDPRIQACYAFGRVPLEAEATVNMQSDARHHGS